MNNSIFALLSLLCFLSPFHFSHADDRDSMEVRLSTESRLSPLYLAPLSSNSESFSALYLDSLLAVLHFDFAHNGFTQIIKSSSELDNLTDSEQFGTVENMQTWKNKNIAYVLKGILLENSLSLQVINTLESSIKQSPPLPLSGNLDKDRKQIHRLSDILHKELFKKEGIASTKILYAYKPPANSEANWISEIWEMDYDGGNPKQVTHEQTCSISPFYLPPKASCLSGGFLYVSYRSGQPKIYAASLKGGAGKRVIYLGGNQFMPTVSLQRDRIAFISDITGNPDLFVQDFDPEKGVQGKPQQIFSARQATQGSPSFSPDGKRIAFVSNKDGSPKIYIIDIPKPGASLKEIRPILISKRNRENSAPAWSPDGTKIAYCARTSGDRQIWVYDIESKEEKQMTQGPGNKENPSWAPNSLHIAFNTVSQDAAQLYFIHLNDREATLIPSLKGEKRYPSWEPKGCL